MARGWESKSVESQIADEAQRDVQRPALSEDERRRRRRRNGLELARTRVLDELALTESPIRRAALESALAVLEGELAQLGPSS